MLLSLLSTISAISGMIIGVIGFKKNFKKELIREGFDKANIVNLENDVETLKNASSKLTESISSVANRLEGQFDKKFTAMSNDIQEISKIVIELQLAVTRLETRMEYYNQKKGGE